MAVGQWEQVLKSSPRKWFFLFREEVIDRFELRADDGELLAMIQKFVCEIQWQVWVYYRICPKDQGGGIYSRYLHADSKEDAIELVDKMLSLADSFKDRWFIEDYSRTGPNVVASSGDCPG